MSFQNGVEFRITIEGETWRPGESIKGKIESKPLAQAQVILAEGSDKKVKTKSPDAFIVLSETVIPTTPGEWTFSLPIDTRISDKNGALYILYGHGDAMEKLGQLRLNILPNLHLSDLVDLLSTHFRFALKSFSSGKAGLTEVKLDPPSSKDWSMLEGLTLFCKFSPTQMECKFQFQRKEVDATKGGLATKSVKRELQRSWKIESIIHDFNQRLNKDIMTAEFEQIISEYKGAGWLSS